MGWLDWPRLGSVEFNLILRFLVITLLKLITRCRLTSWFMALIRVDLENEIFYLKLRIAPPARYARSNAYNEKTMRWNVQSYRIIKYFETIYQLIWPRSPCEFKTASLRQPGHLKGLHAISKYKFVPVREEIYIFYIIIRWLDNRFV